MGYRGSRDCSEEGGRDMVGGHLDRDRARQSPGMGIGRDPQEDRDLGSY